MNELTDQQIDKTVRILIDDYKISTYKINQLLGALREQVERLVEDTDPKEKLRLLLLNQGAELFSGSSDEVRSLRKYLLEQLSKEKIKVLFERIENVHDTDFSVTNYARKLSEKRWHRGKRWPKSFMKAFNLPLALSGATSDKKPPDFEDVEPRLQLPYLKDFQKDLKERMLTVLNKEHETLRCMLTLPTGGGKTRTSVEAFVEWMRPRFAENLYLIWIAQSEELCEQAIQCIREVWSTKEFSESLRIYRYFGGRKLKDGILSGGVLVASIHQLNSRLDSEEVELWDVIQNTGAVIIDEAHHATTMMYKRFYSEAKIWTDDKMFPICGLSATPGRMMDTPELVNEFDLELFKPDLDAKYDNNPVQYFRDKGYLAQSKHENVFTDLDIINETPTLFENINIEKFSKTLEDEHFRESLANNEQRNRIILKRLLQIDSNKPVLLYACTVNHAKLLAILLNASGRTSKSVDANTPKPERRKMIEEFKKGKIQFLCNYGVLTTGFDAPKIEYIVICRPTTSPVLYEQMVGRGQRGPKFGGTEVCTTIDFTDNYKVYGKQLAYKRFEDYWVKDTKVNDEKGAESENREGVNLSLFSHTKNAL